MLKYDDNYHNHRKIVINAPVMGLRGGGKRAKSSAGKSIDKQEMIESIKNDLTAKLQYLSTINDRDLMSVCEHIATFEKGVTANPTGSLTQALSLLDTSTLEKISAAVKNQQQCRLQDKRVVQGLLRQRQFGLDQKRSVRLRRRKNWAKAPSTYR